MRSALFFFIGIIVVFLPSCLTSYEPEVHYLTDWHYKLGDDPRRANPGMDTDDWQEVKAGAYMRDFDQQPITGYSWFRITTRIPSSLKLYAYLNDSIAFDFGIINGADQFFLNGRLVGQNGRTLSAAGQDLQGLNPGSLPESASQPGSTAGRRTYVLAANDSLVHWDKPNTLALRVYMQKSSRALASRNPSVSMKDFDDYITISRDFRHFEYRSRQRLTKRVVLYNASSSHTFNGKLSLFLSGTNGTKSLLDPPGDVTMGPGDSAEFRVDFEVPERMFPEIRYRFREQNSNLYFSEVQEIPGLLTPEPKAAPVFNYPRVYGVSPLARLIIRVPVSGERPLQLSSPNLPGGLTLSADKPVISGSLPAEGRYPFTLVAENDQGRDSAEFVIAVGEGHPLTPPMSWNNRDFLSCELSSSGVEDMAAALIQSGMADYGWNHVNVQDCWQSRSRNPSNKIIFGNSRFSDIRELAGNLHENGMKLGLYSGPVPYTCNGYPGSLNNEYTDAWTWNAWNVDYLTYEYCPPPDSLNRISDARLRRSYFNMGNALQSISGDIVYHAVMNERTFDLTGNYRIDVYEPNMDTLDILKLMYGDYDTIPFSGGDYWLGLGNLIMGEDQYNQFQSPNQLHAYISFMAMMPATFMISSHPDSLDLFSHNLLTNREVLAVNQAPGRDYPGLLQNGYSMAVWHKPMEDGSHVYALLNKTRAEITIERKGFMRDESRSLRDLWRQQALDKSKEGTGIRVAPLGVRMLKESGE